MLQYHILQHLDAPGYQILKNLNFISTGVLNRIYLRRSKSLLGMAMDRVWIGYTHTRPENFTHGYPIINTR